MHAGGREKKRSIIRKHINLKIRGIELPRCPFFPKNSRKKGFPQIGLIFKKIHNFTCFPCHIILIKLSISYI